MEYLMLMFMVSLFIGFIFYVGDSKRKQRESEDRIKEVFKDSETLDSNMRKILEKGS